ncbi:MAG: oxygenase MpaB family protein [Pseudomonadota bacterium]|nr:oxygenase MpaB family protein [Pseudomonadota bacterium]
MPRLLPLNPAEAVRRRLAREVHQLFHSSRDEPRVMRSPDALIARDSVAWRVHGDVTTMMIGGIAALLLQMLHPAALAGVWDHSNFEADMLGRLRRTARFIAVTTYADRRQGEAIIKRVASIHDRVHGTLPDGRAYSANDPATLAFVHVAGALCFLDAYIRFVEPGMQRADQDRYFVEVAGTACALGADPVPTSRAEAEALLDRFRPELTADARTRRVRDLIIGARVPHRGAAPVQAMLMQAATDLLPRDARRMHGLARSRLSRPALNLATAGLSRTLRWALRG